jgi:hypothetical protein
MGFIPPNNIYGNALTGFVPPPPNNLLVGTTLCADFAHFVVEPIARDIPVVLRAAAVRTVPRKSTDHRRPGEHIVCLRQLESAVKVA